MMHKRTIIGIGSMFLAGFLFTGITSFVETKAELHDKAYTNAMRSMELLGQSQAEYCAVYTAYLSSCYKHNQKACDMLSVIDSEYNGIFLSDPDSDCSTLPKGAITHEEGMELMETQVATPDEQTNPLYFDDSLAQ